MTFLQVSPRRQLEQKFGTAARSRPLTCDWFGWRCGDRVRWVGDERHEGTVVEIWNSAKLKVRWDETSWLSWVYPREVTKI